MADLSTIVDAIKTQLVGNVPKLSTGNVFISYDSQLEIPDATASHYGAVIFFPGMDFEGFPGGMEMKVVTFNLVLWHVRSTDQLKRDEIRFKTLVTDLSEKSRDALNGQILTGMDEPLEQVREDMGPKAIGYLIRADQHWRFMFHHFIKDRINA